MKASYKIALAVSVALCILAVVLIKGDKQPEATDTTGESTQAQAAPEPRKTLRTDSPGDGSLKSMVESRPQPPSNQNTNTIASDARSRILAAQEQDKAETAAADASTAKRTDAPSNPVNLNIGTTTTGPIALARTEAEPVKAETKTEPDSTTVNPDTLDAIFGPSGASSNSLTGNDQPPTAGSASRASTTNRPVANTSSLDTYTVQPGDLLSTIAEELYGDERRWVDIAQANPSVDPTRLKIGQVLRLPDETFTLSQEEPTPKGPGQVQTYEIQANDNLSTVAERYYNDPTLWRVIYNYNRDKIGDNPNAIQVGMVIQIPPKLTGAQ